MVTKYTDASLAASGQANEIGGNHQSAYADNAPGAQDNVQFDAVETKSPLQEFFDWVAGLFGFND